mmetsp:Transcript_14391/g.35943  ORF Transcript_14391/g.35943 Transcript_14391/m.35943 type:complete len:191 (+) Transcript_14391:101-673(+)
MLNTIKGAPPPAPSGRVRGTQWRHAAGDPFTVEEQLPVQFNSMGERVLDIYRGMRQETTTLGVFLKQQMKADESVARLNKSVSQPQLRRNKDYGEHPRVQAHMTRIADYEAELRELQPSRDKVADKVEMFSRVARFKRAGLVGERSVPSFDKWKAVYGTNSRQTDWKNFACDRHKVVRWTSRDPLSLRGT